MAVLRVLVVDDSPLFRSQIKRALADATDLVVAGEAENGALAIEYLRQHPIEVVILDLDMPVKNGLQTLAELRRLGIRARVIVFSTLSHSGAQATLQALELGAWDFAQKPTLSPGEAQKPYEKLAEVLLPKIRQFNSVATIDPAITVSKQAEWKTFFPRAIAIASSTGGPSALEKLFSSIEGPLTVPVFVTQHMPAQFTKSLAERIRNLSGIPCDEAMDGEAVRNGKIYIAPGNFHLELVGTATNAVAKLHQAPLRQSVRPCADYLFETAARVYQRNCLGVVLTGMGADGREGALAVKKHGGRVIIQSKETCVVYGMPGAVQAAGAYDQSSSLEEIAQLWKELNICKAIKKVA